MKKLIILLLLCNLCFGAWDNTKPSDAQTWNSAAGSIRSNWDAIEGVLGVDLAGYFGQYEGTAPSTRADGSTALTAADNGMVWVDANDGRIYRYKYSTGTAAKDWRMSNSSIRPEWFGATADGSTNDLVALQACLDALTAGQVMELTDGKTYKTTGVLSYPTGLEYSGIVCNGIAIISSTSTGNVLEFTGDGNSRNVFEGVNFVSTTATSIIYISGTYFSQNIFNRIELKGNNASYSDVTHGLCMMGTYTYHNVFSDLKVWFAEYAVSIGYDFVTSAASGNAVNANSFYNLYLYEAKYGVYIYGGYPLIWGLYTNHFTSGNTDVYIATLGGGTQIHGGYLESGGTNGIYIADGATACYIDVIIATYGGYAIKDDNVDTVTVPFNSGGTTGFAVGNTVVGGTSAASGTVNAIIITSGTYAGGDAVGTLVINRTTTATYANAEALNVTDVDQGTTTAAETERDTGVWMLSKENIILLPNQASGGPTVSTQTIRTSLIRAFAGEDIRVQIDDGQNFNVYGYPSNWFQITREGAMSYPTRVAMPTGTTPSVVGGTLFYVNNTGAITISDFLNGTDGQHIFMTFLNGNTTLDFTSNAEMVGNGGSDYVGSAKDLVECIYVTSADLWFCSCWDGGT